ncbi:hypothetical protein NSQ26_07770 [Bacillus sp. FSL W7-1360]
MKKRKSKLDRIRFYIKKVNALYETVDAERFQRRYDRLKQYRRKVWEMCT